MISCVVAFLPIVSVLVLVPGVNNVNVLRGTLTSGPLAGMAVAWGASTGIVIWSTAVGLGVGGLLDLVPGGLPTVRVAGAVFLVVSGLRMLRSEAAEGSDGGPTYRTGLLVCLGNPRAMLTAVSVLPEHSLATAVLPSTLLLGAVWAGLAVAWNVVFVAAIRCGLLGGSSGGSAWVMRGSGLAVAGLGVVSLV